MRNRTDIRHDITNAIIDSLKNNSLLPWRRTWIDDPNSGLPTSLSTGRRYAGINSMILQCSAAKQNFKSKGFSGSLVAAWGNSRPFICARQQTPETGEPQMAGSDVVRKAGVLGICRS